MGRLFWKFFLTFWLTLIIVAIVVGSGVRLRYLSSDNADVQQPLLDHHAEMFISPIASLAQHADSDSFKRYLAESQSFQGMKVYVLDVNDHDLLDRPLEAELIDEVKRQFQLYGNKGSVRQVTTPQNQQLFLFAVKLDKLLPGANKPPMPPPPFAGKHNGPPPPPPPLLLLITVGIVASLIFSGLLAWYFTKPIRHLRNAFTAVSQGKLDTRISGVMHNRKDELTELGLNFDDMVSKLQGLISSQQQLLYDVSHELRSPLARMHAAIGVAQQQPEKRQQTFERLENEIKRISDLIGELLMLSYVENTDNLHSGEKINFPELMNEIIEDTRYEADEKNINISFENSPSFLIVGFEELLRRAIENIIRNAIKFSPPTSSISVVMTETNEQLSLTISDQGPGVAEEYLPAIFNPFFRIDKQSNDSSGLGLAIALRAIEKHNGAITATNKTDGKGLIISINLPL